jgi:hypothetical protein
MVNSETPLLPHCSFDCHTVLEWLDKYKCARIQLARQRSTSHVFAAILQLRTFKQSRVKSSWMPIEGKQKKLQQQAWWLQVNAG